ncbi:hypothetical protein ACE6H2_002023 [Prunus campanulata]
MWFQSFENIVFFVKCCNQSNIVFLSNTPELCTLELHNFGLLENGVYKGGKVCFANNCADDHLSLLDLKKIGAELGYKVDITQKVTSLKVFYKNTLGSKKEEVWPSLVSEKYANVAEEDARHINGNEEEHVQVESNGKEVDNEEEDVAVESDGSEEENEEKKKDEELKNSDYEYTDDEMPNIDLGMILRCQTLILE